MKYFSEFPFAKYELSGKQIVIRDLFRMTDIDDALSDNSLSYLETHVIDGERPDQLSYRLYGDPSYHWTFFIVNDSLRDGAWPVSSNQLEKFCQESLDPFSILMIVPNISSDGARYNDPESMELGDNVGFRFDPENITGKIHTYDSSSHQLWVSELNHQFQDNFPGITFEWIGEEGAEKVAWLEKVAENLIRDGNPYMISLKEVYDNGIIAREVFNTMIEAYITSLVFVSTRKWNSARNAPARYLAEVDGRVVEVSVHDATALGVVDSYESVSDFLTNKNFELSRLRTIRPDRIQDFIDTWRAVKQ